MIMYDKNAISLLYTILFCLSYLDRGDSAAGMRENVHDTHTRCYRCRATSQGFYCSQSKAVMNAWNGKISGMPT